MALKLKNKQAFDMLNDWSSAHLELKNNVIIQFSDSYRIGTGKSESIIKTDSHLIKVGIHPLSKSFFVRNEIIDDSDFVKIGVTLFHEIAHYNRSIESDTPKEILLSDLSKVGNNQYYKDNWAIFPHEVDAEYTGIMTMWSHLDNAFPNNADELMINKLTDRTKPDKIKYIFEKPENGFQSKEQIDILFDRSYDKSLIVKRVLSSKFLRSNDEIAQLFMNNNDIRSDYYPFYNQIQMSNTGQEIDIKMASLVSYIHPELQRFYSKLDFKEIDPSSVFGISMPETRDEILSHINLQSNDAILSESNEQSFLSEINEQSFADAVADISIHNEYEQSV